jgi:hypothetical protein
MQKNRMMHQLNGLLDDGKTRVRDFADDMEARIRTEAGQIARRARTGLVEGRDQIIAAEETVIRNVKANPVAFALAGLSLVGLFVAILMFERRARLG